MVSLQTQAKKSSKNNPNPVDVHAGSRLRLRRNLMGMSQEQLGTALGLTFQQIQKYERGINRISASRLHQICQILNVNVDYFFNDMPANQAVAMPGGFAESGQDNLEGTPSAKADDQRTERNWLQERETMDLIRAYYRITDIKKRRTVVELIKSMADGNS